MNHAHTGDRDGRLPRVSHGLPLRLIGLYILFPPPSSMSMCSFGCRIFARVVGLDKSSVRTMPGRFASSDPENR